MTQETVNWLLDVEAVWSGFFWSAGALPIVAIAIMILRWMLASHLYDEYERGFVAGQELERARILQAQYLVKIDECNAVLSERMAQPIRDRCRPFAQGNTAVFGDESPTSKTA